MGEVTGIPWCHHTFNPWIGCAKVSPACDHCYAEAGSRRLGAQHGLKLWEGDRYVTSASYWSQPLKWNRAARRAGERRRVFCASFADVFESGLNRLDRVREQLWRLIEETPDLDWLLLTKRPQNIRNMVPQAWLDAPRANVWFGTTAESQVYADDRISELLKVPAAVRFVSHEPALGPVDFMRWLTRGFPVSDGDLDAPDGAMVDGLERVGDHWVRRAGLDWIITGGESGPGARPYEVAWARDVLDQCRRTGTACFIKQLGRVPTVLGVPVRYHEGCVGDEGWEAGRLNDPKGGDWEEWPQQLRVREFPTARRAA